MELNQFGVFDIMMRAMVVLGVLIAIFSNIVRIANYRKQNESMTLIKYYNNFFIQNVPLYSSIIAASLTGLAICRVGSLLKVNMSSTPTLVLGTTVIVPPESFAGISAPIVFISIAGALIFITAAILMNAAQYQLGKNFSLYIDIKDHYTLITGGLYGFVRHPIYLFELLFFFAASLALLNWVLFLWTLCIHLPLYLARIKAEDELLEHYYGDKFIRYKDKVNALFPLKR